MLTLKDLRRELDGLPKKDERTPQCKSLLESSEKVLAKYIGNGSEVTVYGNGYVLYRGGTKAVVFPFPKSTTYVYKSPCGMADISIDDDYFDCLGCWYFRLILEGEDRLSHNADNRFYYRTISYSAISEEWKELADPVGSAEDVYSTEEDKKTVLESVDLLTKKQRYVVTEHFLNDVTYTAIANDLGVSRQAVRDIAGNALRQMGKRFLTERKTDSN